MLENNVKMIVAACGTVSSVAGKKLESNLPVPYTGVINPTAFATAKKTKTGRIGVIATAATISTHNYKARLEKLNPEFKVFEKACLSLFRLWKTDLYIKTIRLFASQ